MTVILKAQQAEIRLDLVASAPDVKDKFVGVFRRGTRKDAEAFAELSKGKTDTELLSNWLIRIEDFSDANAQPVPHSDELVEALLGSVPYLEALTRGMMTAIFNRAETNAQRLGNLSS